MAKRKSRRVKRIQDQDLKHLLDLIEEANDPEEPDDEPESEEG